MTHLPILVIAIPLLFAFALPLVYALVPSIRRPAVSAMGLIQFGLVAWMFLSYRASGIEVVAYPLGGWGPEVGIVLQLDALSAAFCLMMALGVLMVILYSQDYVDAGESKYFVLLFIVAGGMMGLVLTADFFNLYVFIEMTAIASFPLVALGRSGRAVFAAYYYMVFTMISSALILLAIILIYGATGSLNMLEVSAVFADLSPGIRSTIVVSMLIGFGVKVALVPFHSWLPPAHAESVSPVSALLSGVLLKTGVYLLIRTMTLFGEGAVASTTSNMLLGLGIATVLGGNILALGQSNVKRILACSSVAHMGYIALGLGIGSPLALGGSIFHALNHLLTKSGAFFAVGRMGHGDFELDKLRGSGLLGGAEGVAFGACTGALIGLPPFGSFASKVMLMAAAIAAGMYHIALIMPAGAILSAIYYGKVYRVVYDPPVPGKGTKTPARTTLILVLVTAGSVATLVFAMPLARWFTEVANLVLG